MPPGAQIAFAKDWLERQGIESQTIDVTAHIDPTLSYEENIKLLKRQFRLGGGRSRQPAARGMTAAECDVAIGNFDAGYNSEVTRDACKCGHPEACEKLERQKRAKQAEKPAAPKRKPAAKPLSNCVYRVDEFERIAQKWYTCSTIAPQNSFDAAKKLVAKATKKRQREIEKAGRDWRPNAWGADPEHGARRIVKVCNGKDVEYHPATKADEDRWQEWKGVYQRAEARTSIAKVKPKKTAAPKPAPLSKYQEAEKLHRSSWGLLPKNALDRLLKAKFILEHELGETDSELYRENERLIANYKRKLGIGAPATPSVPPILAAPPELAADVLGAEEAALHASERRGELRRETRWQAEQKPAAKPKRKPATKKPAAAKPKKPAKPKAKKTAATPKLTPAQREYLAINGFVMVKRGGKYVRITG